jgi:hypothetical protein
MSDVSIGPPGQQGSNEPTGNDGKGNKTLDPKPVTKPADNPRAWPFPARPGNDLSETRQPQDKAAQQGKGAQ